MDDDVAKLPLVVRLRVVNSPVTAARLLAQQRRPRQEFAQPVDVPRLNCLAQLLTVGGSQVLHRFGERA